jgi:hypothetical protein
MPSKAVTFQGVITWADDPVQPPWWPGHPEHPIPPVVGGGPIVPPVARPPWWPGHPEHPIPPGIWPTPPTGGQPPLGTWGGDAPWPGYATPPIAYPPWWPGYPAHPIPPGIWPTPPGQPGQPPLGTWGGNAPWPGYATPPIYYPPGGGGGGELPPEPPGAGGPSGGASQPIAPVPGPGGVFVFYWSPVYGWVAKPAGPAVPPTATEPAPPTEGTPE